MPEMFRDLSFAASVQSGITESAGATRISVLAAQANARYGYHMSSIHVSASGARKLVQQSVRDGHHVAYHPPHRRIAVEDAGNVARRLVDATLGRQQAGSSVRSKYETNLIEELDRRETRGSAEAFAAAAEIEWIRQHEEGYPDSGLSVDARQGPHGSPGHVCWRDLRTVSSDDSSM
jgi:hypothetical protein